MTFLNFISLIIIESKKKPETIKDIICDYIRDLCFKILEFYGIDIPPMTSERFDFAIAFRGALVCTVTFMVFFYVLFNSYNIFMFARKVTGKLGSFMENKIILRELLIIYNFFDYLAKKIFYGVFLVTLTLTLYFLFSFFELWFIVNFSYYCLGLKDFVTVFIYRV